MMGVLGPHGGQQRGKGPEDDVQRAVGAEEIGHQAPHEQARGGGGEEEGQYAQSLRKPALDRAVGDAEDRSEVGQHRVQRGNDAGSGQLVGGKAGIGHEKRPPDVDSEVLVRIRTAKTRVRPGDLHFFV